ncbi:MAG: polymorphic toxin-type HINT domain-containing protein, partial [Thermoguttaceae bacterium]|nr:polymorphic toxin-type HINT domain-containing protein [Thermoguttaceae bacterium]
KYATKAIRDFRGFEWVLARNPEVGEEERSQFDAIDHREWRWVELELTKSDGDLLRVGLGRPIAWLTANDIEAGATTWLDLEEMGAVGYATVVSVAPCPDPGPKPHPDCRLVTGVFRHSSADCVNVHVAGLDAPIGTTCNHRFWSEDRQAFVEAAHLHAGETLLTADGTLTSVLSITPRPGPKPVYNLEVDVEHVYYVSSDGILVHNMYKDSVGRWHRNSGQFAKRQGRPSKVRSRPHGNRLDSRGPHDVYVMRDASTGELLHFGQTGRGAVRFYEQVRAFKSKYGREVVPRHLRTVEGKAAAKALETRYIKTYENIFGKLPPFNFNYQ